MRTALILASLATTLVALNPQAEGEENSSLHVPQRASSPMVRVGEDTKPDANSKPSPEMNSKNPPAAGADTKGNEHKPAAKQGEEAADKSEDAESLPQIFHKMLPGIADLLFPETSSSTPAPSPTMGAAAAASASGKLFHFDDEKNSGGGQGKRAVAPQAVPAADVTEAARHDADAETVMYRTVTRTRTETDCACASSVNGVLATATGASADAVPAPVRSSNAVVATQRVQTPETNTVAMPMDVDSVAATATSVHAGLSGESAVPSAHNVLTTTTSGSVFVHGASTPVIRSATRTVVASAFPTHSAFVAQTPSSSGAAMPSGVDPQTNSKDQGEMFTGGAAWTGPRGMVVMGVTGFLAVMLLL